MKKTWNWEIAYKKLFFVRFVLLLIALGLSIALAYLMFSGKMVCQIG